MRNTPFNNSLKHRGFTLVELMLVITIIGVIASLAIPMFLNYTARSQASEAFVLLGGLKNPIAEEWTFYGTLPDNDDLDAFSTSGDFVESITIAPGTNEYVATFRNGNVSPKLTNQVMTMVFSTLDESFSFVCTFDEGARPKGCDDS